MSKLDITPDIAELMGAYLEGNPLSSQEREIVQNAMNRSGMDSILSEVSSFPVMENDTFPVGTELLAGEMAMDFMDNNYLTAADMHTDSIIGDVTPCPDMMSHDIIQHQSDTCAIKSQQIILHSFGVDIPEEILTIEATSRGYYVPGKGSAPSLVGMLLEDHGVGTHTKYHATVYDLAAELAQGHKVIVGVDADELWRPSFYNDLFGEQANHALIVTGIDTSNPYDVHVLITDPGTGDVARSYPMAQFLDAWHDSSCMMVATDTAPLISYDGVVVNPEMINFDYASGHIPYIANIPYDIFADNMLPRFDYYFDHQLSDLHSTIDYQHLFDHMDDAYDNFDQHFASNDSSNDNWDINGIDDLFSPLLI